MVVKYLPIKILIINLDRSKERLAYQEGQSAKCGLVFTRLRAVEPNDFSDETFGNLCERWERPMLREEVAGFLSHVSAWQYVQQSNAPALILEDDVVWSCNIANALGALSKMEDIDYVTLEVRGRRKLVSRSKTGITKHLNLIRLYQDRSGAAGYVLWPSGAKKLLNRYAKNEVALADAFICRAYDLKAFQVEPACIIQLDKCDHYQLREGIKTESTITPQNRHRPEASSKKAQLLCKTRRIRVQMRMLFRHLSKTFGAGAQRRFIQLDKSTFEDQV